MFKENSTYFIILITCGYVFFSFHDYFSLKNIVMTIYFYIFNIVVALFEVLIIFIMFSCDADSAL